MRAFLVALQFLTSLPVHLGAAPDEREIGRSLAWYPVVGLLLGGVLLLAASTLGGAPPLLGAALLLTLWVLLSGGLHLDGLVDSADAWVGGLGERDRTLAIMKDPCCGPAGVVAVVLLLLLKFSALYTLLETTSLAALLLAPALGRMVLPLLFLTTPYVRRQGLGSALATHAPLRLVMLIGIAVLAVLALLVKGNLLWPLVTTVSLFLVLRTMTMRRLDGMTGDVAGALVEVVEAAVLITVVLI
ncbi:MAG TPA: adenosylcobinamide-GDP ribazoletransferase [Gammaproteobacteria bacterium]|nr:adenosylcobinamide-GDP ribazoletransferase [Gammaproteobacteria bacterium]